MSLENLSRRSMMTAAVTLAAIPAVAIMPAAAETAGNPDAELLALSPKLESLIADWKAQHAIDEQHHATLSANMRKTTGNRT